MCANYASNAYNYSVKAYYSLNLEDCKKNSMRAIKELSMSEEKGYELLRKKLLLEKKMQKMHFIQQI